MSDLRLHIGNDVRYFHTFPYVSTSISLSIDNIHFPDVKWTDFTDWMLNQWLNDLHRWNTQINAEGSLNFFDGPYRIDLAKRGTSLTLSLICFRTTPQCLQTITCAWQDILDLIRQATSDYRSILLHASPSPQRNAALRQAATLCRMAQALFT